MLMTVLVRRRDMSPITLVQLRTPFRFTSISWL
jgi:hypothetical protein